MKRCCSCKTEKPTSEFGRRNDRQNGLRSDCNECRAEKAAQKRPAVDQLHAAQGKKCASCGAHKPQSEYHFNKCSTTGLSADRGVQINWQYATEWDRGDPLLNTMAAAFGLTDAQVDDVFRVAATL